MTVLVDETVELDAAHWSAWRPTQVAELLRDVDAAWAIAGGWAIDLFLGTETREHADVEIAVPADAFDDIVAALDGFELFVVVGTGRGTPLEDARDRFPDRHQTWVRDPATSRYVLDVMREPATDETWVYRRDERVQMPRARAVQRTGSGIPYLRPEIVLLFKSTSVERKHQRDFEAVLPHLDRGARTWLSEALGLVDPGHCWIAELAR